MLRGRPRFDDGILDKAEASFFYIGHIELCLRFEYHIQGIKNLSQLAQLAGIAAGKHYGLVIIGIVHQLM